MPRTDLSQTQMEDSESYFAKYFLTSLVLNSIKVSLEYLSLVKIIHFVMPSNIVVIL